MTAATPLESPLSAPCEKCSGRGYRRERAGDRATAVLCECSRNCARCGGTGYRRGTREETFSEKVGKRNYEVLTVCDCRELKKRVERFSEIGIPAVLANADFEGYRALSSPQDRARQVAHTFTKELLQTGRAHGFILSGPVGTGKTHLMAAALAQVALESSIRARYVEISLLYATIRRGFQEGKSGGEIIGPLSQVDLLAIDELGKGRGSQFELDTLDELISRRYNAGKVTLFATNYPLDPEAPPPRGNSKPGYTTTEEARSASREPQVLRERVGERIYSRLCEMCTFIEITGAADYRQTKQELEQRQLTRAPSPSRARRPGA